MQGVRTIQVDNCIPLMRIPTDLQWIRRSRYIHTRSRSRRSSGDDFVIANRARELAYNERRYNRVGIVSEDASCQIIVITLQKQHAAFSMHDAQIANHGRGLAITSDATLALQFEPR